MENSALEALKIGVNVFIFIIALSAAIMLMTNILDMVEYANEISTLGMNGTLAQSIGVVNERLYTGEQMLTYYNRNNNKHEFYVRLSNQINDKLLSSYIATTSIYNYLDKEFELEYKGKSGNKEEYVFVLK